MIMVLTTLGKEALIILYLVRQLVILMSFLPTALAVSFWSRDLDLSPVPLDNHRIA